MTNKAAENGVSYLNTFNPISGFFGGGDKVPQWAYSIFPDDPDLSHLIFKSGACALLAAGVVGGIRALKHFDNVSEMSEDDGFTPALKSQVSTTFEFPLGQKKSASEDGEAPTFYHGTGDPDVGYYESTASAANILGMALPVGATLLAATLAYKGVDEWASERRNRILDESLRAKSQTVKQLIQARARIAKANISDAEVADATSAINNNDAYVKTAALHKKALFDDFFKGFTTNEKPQGQIAQSTLQAYGFLAATLLAVSAIGGYSYFSATDKNNLRYKALKKGLKQYARNKSNLQPITIIPEDAAEYFKAIDGDIQPATVRQEPTTDPDDLNKPISITL